MSGGGFTQNIFKSDTKLIPPMVSLDITMEYV